MTFIECFMSRNSHTNLLLPLTSNQPWERARETFIRLSITSSKRKLFPQHPQRLSAAELQHSNCANQPVGAFKDMFQVCPWKWLRRSALRTPSTPDRLHMKQLVLHASITMANAPKSRHVAIAISKDHHADSQPSPDCCFFKKKVAFNFLLLHA